MRITIETDPPGPLRVVRSIPDARLAVLEGLNGIGKSLAVRILMLCTGQMPYQLDSAAWHSLCTGLGRFRVSISNLVGANEIAWVGDSRLWIDESHRESGHVDFESIEIDGESASMEDVRALLVVHRVAGDEDILTTFAQHADATATTVNRWAAQMTSAPSNPLSSLETAVDDVIKQCGDWSLPRFKQYLTTRTAAENEFIEIRTRAGESQQRVLKMRTAVQISQQLQELSHRTPGIEQKLVEVDDRISKVSRERDRLLSQVAEISAQVVIEEPRKQELQNAQRTLARNRHKLSQELVRAAAAVQPLGIRADEPVVEELVEQSRRELAELTAQAAEIDATPILREILVGATETLSVAEDRGLGEQIAVDDSETGIQLTITQTRRGMANRRRFLADQTAPPELQDIREQINTAQRTLAMAGDVLSILSGVRRFERLVATNEQRVADALAATNPGAADTLRELEAERKVRDDELMQLASERATLSQQLGSVASGTTVDALITQLTDLLAGLGLEESRLIDETSRMEDLTSRTQVEMRRREEILQSARRDVAKAEAEIRSAAATILEAHDLSWLRSAVGADRLPRQAQGIEAQAASLDAIKERLSLVLDRLGAFRVQLAAIQEALRSVAGVLRGQDPKAERYVPEIQRWLGKDFSQWFNDEKVKAELLPDATSDIRVDVAKEEVVWSEGEQRKSRPLESFSSGEQAFAYTRARLAVLDEERPRPANRLIVLDEFGSFIAHDRLSVLLAYLAERGASYTGDQILVILPVSQDYSLQASRAIGHERERFEEWAAQVADRDYLVRELVT
jgi:hypothetical protein